MKPEEFTKLLLKNEFQFITGVPDSLFKDCLTEINTHPGFQHVISNNEGEACALATGYYLGTGRVPTVYLQNSGLGNCLNPLTSLLDQAIYSIPALLLITWRAQPGKKDEPQHIRMGKILTDLLNLLEIPFSIATSNATDMQDILSKAREHLKAKQYPYAILFPNDVIEGQKGTEKNHVEMTNKDLTREIFLKELVRLASPNDVLITTTGKTSRELFEVRESLKQGHQQDFLTVGSMGCASAIAFGMALGQPERRVIVVDGDGACLMRLETMALIGHYKPKNLLHIVIDNNAYESTGGQKTLSDTTDFVSIANACQYNQASQVENLDSFKHEFNTFAEGPKLIVVKVISYSRSNLGRPTTSPLENKRHLMNFLQNHKKVDV